MRSIKRCARIINQGTIVEGDTNTFNEMFGKLVNVMFDENMLSQDIMDIEFQEWCLLIARIAQMHTERLTPHMTKFVTRINDIMSAQHCDEIKFNACYQTLYIFVTHIVMDTKEGLQWVGLCFFCFFFFLLFCFVRVAFVLCVCDKRLTCY